MMVFEFWLQNDDRSKLKKCEWQVVDMFYVKQCRGGAGDPSWDTANESINLSSQQHGEILSTPQKWLKHWNPTEFAGMKMKQEKL